MAKANKGREPSAKQSHQKPPPKQSVYNQEQEDAPPVIRKGIYLSVLIYIEGDQPAPDDFADLTTSTLKHVLTQAFKDDPDGLTITLKKIEPRHDIEEDDGAEAEDSNTFQF